MADDGFLSRWSKRKADARAGVAIDEPVAEWVVAAPGIHAPNPQPVSEDQPPPLTIEDTRSLTPQSDFKPFVQSNVSPDVKNAALKKLFADPHYNVMDGMDTYIDDYSKADPIPEDMLRRMVGSQLLKLFDEPPEENAALVAEPSVTADVLEPEAVAQSDAQPALEASSSSQPFSALIPAHDHPLDLQLQPDHATGPGSADEVADRSQSTRLG